MDDFSFNISYFGIRPTVIGYSLRCAKWFDIQKTFSLRFQSIDNGRLNHIWNTLLRPRLLCDVFSLDIVPVNTMPDQDPEIEFYRVATFPELDVDP